MGPFGPEAARIGGRGGQWLWVRGVIGLLMFLVVVALVVWAVKRFTDHRYARGGTATGAPPPMAATAVRDPALEEIRLRYARGEITREEFLERNRDLGGPSQADAEG